MKKFLMGLMAVVIAATAVYTTNAKANTKTLATFYYYEFDESGDLIPGSLQEIEGSSSNPFSCPTGPDVCSRAYSSTQVGEDKLPLAVGTFTAQINREND
jgi:hypothetical protein